eukprot:PITA_34921
MPKNDPPIVQKKGKEIVDPTTSKTPSSNERFNQPSASKEKTKKKDVSSKQVEKISVFNLENEIAKLKVSIPLTKTMKNSSYKDSLAIAASNLKIPMNSKNKFEIHVKHHPVVLDNQSYWQVFQDDEEINGFLQNEGLIPLEEFFDQDDVARKPSLLPTEKGVENVNIGSTENPRMVKLSKVLPPHVKEKYIGLLYSFTDVFAWDYSYLKAYDISIIQHIIPIKPNQKPFHQKLRRINPNLLPSIEKEVNQLYKAGIIVPIRFSDWISNLVPVHKKTGEIRLCIDFRNLNKVSLKDNYPLPKMDHILQIVFGASRMSLLDGYLGYNQILVHEDDRDKTTFTTLWGTFHYAKMPFGLKNAGATFQRVMDISFANEKDVFLVVYLDDLKTFSNSDEEQLYHLKIVF